MEIEIKQILLQILNFGILFFVLVKFLFRPILKILDTRSQRIAEGLALAEKNRQAQEEIEKKSNEVMKKAEKKASMIVDEARRESKELGKQMIEQAKVEAQKTVDKQQAAFMERMHDEENQFKARVADLVSTTTQKVLADSLTASDIKAITKKEISKLKVQK
jgi:F-type H+-transporting ATPase subunit b